MKIEFRKFLILLGVVAGILLVTTFIYSRSVPDTYDLNVGDVSEVDIVATADVPDIEATEARAADEAARISLVMTRSEEISRESLNLMNDIFAMADAERERVREAARSTSNDVQEGTNNVFYYRLSEEDITEAAKKLAEDVEKKTNLRLSDDVYRTLINSESSIYQSIKEHSVNLAEQIMEEKHDALSLSDSINRKMNVLLGSTEYYKDGYSSVRSLLSGVLQPNAVHDEEATRRAREAAATQVRQNPIMIPKGTRIVSLGDTITKSTYEQLLNLNLIDTGTFNYRSFFSILFVVMLGMGTMFYYLYRFEKDKLSRASDWLTIALVVILPLLLSGWLMQVSSLASPIVAATILLTIYFRMRCGIVLSGLMMIVMMPMAGNDPLFLVTGLSTIIVSAILTEQFALRNRYALLILGTVAAAGVSAFAFNFLMKASLMKAGTDAGIAALAGALSAILAIGTNPIVELFMSSVSPMKLVELAQPSHPLLRKLFLEAPGTYQHCIMVANLAETAADAVGANPLLVRVGSYYHDIGKTYNPHMFTENQADRNPHDNLSPEKSVEIIIAHIQQGLNIAKKYRLPIPVQRIMMEHHGNTLQAYFYSKAQKIAEAEGTPPPEEADFRYPWPVPTCKESAIVMMADSCEAAMKSMEIDELPKAEELIRRIIKGKIDQDQLVSSGLSFQDVETIIQSFLKVYSGQFHKRVRYPSDSINSKPATA